MLKAAYMGKDVFLGYVGKKETDFSERRDEPVVTSITPGENWSEMLFPNEPGHMDPVTFKLDYTEEEWTVEREELFGGAVAVNDVAETGGDEEEDMATGLGSKKSQSYLPAEPNFKRAYEEEEVDKGEPAGALVGRPNLERERPLPPRRPLPKKKRSILGEEAGETYREEDERAIKEKRVATGRKKRAPILARGKLGRCRKPNAKTVKGVSSKGGATQDVPYSGLDTLGVKPIRVEEPSLALTMAPKIRSEKKRKPRRGVPEEEKDKDYLLFRERNNIAARKCRAKNKQEGLMQHDSWEESFDNLDLPPPARMLLRYYRGQIGVILMSAFELGRRYPATSVNFGAEPRPNGPEFDRP